MGVVSLNLSVNDADCLQRALTGVVADCSCWLHAADEPCERCRTLCTVIADLHQCLTREPHQRPTRLACGNFGSPRIPETLVLQFDPAIVPMLLNGTERHELAN